MVYNRIPDTHHKIKKHPPADFKILDCRVSEKDDFDLNPDVEHSFTIKIKVKGDTGNAVNMVMDKLDGIEGEWHTQSHDMNCTLEC